MARASFAVDSFFLLGPTRQRTQGCTAPERSSGPFSELDVTPTTLHSPVLACQIQAMTPKALL